MTSHAMKRGGNSSAAEFIHSEAGWKRSAENLASSADVMETGEYSARLGQDAEKIFGVTGPLPGCH